VAAAGVTVYGELGRRSDPAWPATDSPAATRQYGAAKVSRKLMILL